MQMYLHAYCTSVAHFLNYTGKTVDSLNTDDVDVVLTEKRLSGFFLRPTITIIPVFASFTRKS